MNTARNTLYLIIPSISIVIFMLPLRNAIARAKQSFSQLVRQLGVRFLIVYLSYVLTHFVIGSYLTICLISQGQTENIRLLQITLFAALVGGSYYAFALTSSNELQYQWMCGELYLALSASCARLHHWLSGVCCQ